jgi:hypothetical protein
MVLSLVLSHLCATPPKPASIAPILKQQKDLDDLSRTAMLANGPFESTVPNPESVLGYKIGSRITTYREQELVFDAIQKASPKKAIRIAYGKSNQNFPLRVYAISSEKNIARWAQIQQTIEKCAQSGQQPPAGTPAIVWVNETIHGNEPASFESGMMLFYNLIAGKGAFSKALDNVVVILNPVYNPDGHERFAVSYNSYARGNYEPGNFEAYEIPLLQGRYNQYRFDMNRDRVSFSQIETQQEVKLMQSIRPQIYLDQHGQVQNYFFPPNPMAINANVDRDRLNKWTEILGRECASAFDRAGWSYFIKEDFDFYYPGYLDAHTTLSGAIGITHETDGGKVLYKTRNDGSVVSLREGAAKHMTTALSVIKSAGEKSQELLSDWARYKKAAVTGSHAGKVRKVILASKDKRPLDRLKKQLELTGIQSNWASVSRQKLTDMWTNQEANVEIPGLSLVVDMAQEYGPVAKALIERVSDFEPEFTKAQQEKKNTAPEGENYPGPEGTEFYDLTGWALPFAHNIKAYISEDATPFPKAVPMMKMGSASLPDTTIGYIIRYRDQEDVLAVHDMLKNGVKVSLMSANMNLGGYQFDKGSFLIFKARNGSDLEEKLVAVKKNRDIEFETIPTSYPESGREGPGNRLLGLQSPQIGMIFGNGANPTGMSGTWFAMDKIFKLPFVSLSGNGISNARLSNYTALIAPQGSNILTNTKVKDWVRDGGTLVVLGDNPAAITSFESTPSSRSIPGTIFQAILDRRSILASGYDSETIAVPVEGSSFLKAKKDGGAVVKFGTDEKKSMLLSGWTWGEESEKSLRGSVWMHDEPLGQGHIVWFSFDPNERVMWPGLNKLFLNSLILMPGN